MGGGGALTLHVNINIFLQRIMQVILREDINNMRVKLPAATRNFYVDVSKLVVSIYY